MKKNKIATVRFFVGLNGGEVRCVSPEGEVRFSVGLTPGIHFANTYQPFMQNGDELELSGDVSAHKPGGSRVKAQTYGPKGMESGANPDFRPTVYTEQQAQLQKLIGDITKKTTRLDKRIATLTRLEEERAAAETVVDDDPEDDPEGETGTTSDDEQAEAS